ncbi:MAG: M28 family peptidase [Thermaerobacterales bacterium]
MRIRRTLFDALDAELSGDKAQAMTRELTRFYRSPGATGYHRATDLVSQALESLKIDKLEREVYPLDGKTVFGARQVPMAWEPFGAELTITAPETRHLVSYDEATSCIPWWSASTPEEGAHYEVVDVGTGESEADFEGKDIAGKAVFVRGTERTNGWVRAAALAVEHGAAGVITDYLLYHTPPWRTRENVPDAVQLLRFAPGLKGAWALAIDYHASQTLDNALSRGPVTVYANVRCRTYEGEAVNLTGVIEGSELPEESVYFITHTTAGTKPGANCAGGVALSVEICRTFKALIDSCKLPRPRRSLKFLFVVEGVGSAYFFDQHADEAANIHACFNFDSVGHAQEKLHSAMMFYRAPDSIPSFVNDFCVALMEETPKETDWVFKADRQVPLINFVDMPYTPWSDNHHWNEHKVPTPLIMSWPDLYFHTQLLTADNTDPAVFKRVGLSTAAAAYEIADAGGDRVLEILSQIKSRSTYRMGQVTARTIRQIIDLSQNGRTDLTPEDLIGRSERELRHFLRRDTAAAESVLRLVKHDDEATRKRVNRSVTAVIEALKQTAAQEIAAIEEAELTAAE